jgi:hypothetical protein
VEDKPVVYELYVDGPQEIDTGLLYPDGAKVMRHATEPIGYLDFSE